MVVSVNLQSLGKLICIKHLGIHLIVMMMVIPIFFDLTQSNIVELIGGFKGGKCYRSN